MNLTIVKYPEPVLQQPGEPVTEFNDELRKLIADMFETMYASQGIGLAAPQVAVSKRVTVIDLSMGKDPAQKLVLVNPEIIVQEGKQYEEEGCLSFPDIREKVARAAKGGEALVALTVDSVVPAGLLEEIKAAIGATAVNSISLEN